AVEQVGDAAAVGVAAGDDQVGEVVAVEVADRDAGGGAHARGGHGRRGAGVARLAHAAQGRRAEGARGGRAGVAQDADRAVAAVVGVQVNGGAVGGGQVEVAVAVEVRSHQADRADGAAGGVVVRPIDEAEVVRGALVDEDRDVVAAGVGDGDVGQAAG